MRTLVAAASKHGATEEIAQRIGGVLADAGIDVTIAGDRVEELSSFQAVVLGSAVYAGHWLKEAKDMADQLAGQEAVPRVWLFSSGPVGDPPKPEEDPVDVAGIADRLGAVEHRLFAGRLDKSRLGFGERAIVTALRAPEGDFRDWDEITGWAEAIATRLSDIDA